MAAGGFIWLENTPNEKTLERVGFPVRNQPAEFCGLPWLATGAASVCIGLVTGNRAVGSVLQDNLDGAETGWGMGRGSTVSLQIA